MKKIIFLLMISFSVYSQNDSDDGMIQTPVVSQKEKKEYGAKYLEDQIYIGLTYNHLLSKSVDVVQHNMSRALHVGFLRDLPINERRNVGFAVGLGYSYDLIYSNIFAINSKSVDYQLVRSFDEVGISKNYFDMHTIEVPLEFRWRTSTAEKFKFWRIYSGVRFGYTLGATSLHTQNQNTLYFSNPDLKNNWQVKFFSAFGYNAINFFVQYSVSPILKNVKTNDDISLRANILQMGLMFYIL